MVYSFWLKEKVLINFNLFKLSLILDYYLEAHLVPAANFWNRN